MTFPQAIDLFIFDQQLRGNTDKTIKTYRDFITAFTDWLEKQRLVNIEDLTLSHVQQYQIYLINRPCDNKAKPLARRTVRTYIRHIKIFLGFCFENGYIKEAFHLNIKLPKAEKPLIEILSDQEAEQLITTAGYGIDAKRNRAIISLMLDCGLRLSETAGVKESDIHFDSGYILITGKGRKQRIVPIGRKVSDALRSHGVPPARGAPLFGMTPNAIAGMIKRLKIKSGIPRLHAHLLRHTFATNYLIHGLGDIYELSRILGHADIKITEGYIQLAGYYKILKNREIKTYLDMQ